MLVSENAERSQNFLTCISGFVRKYGGNNRFVAVTPGADVTESVIRWNKRPFPVRYSLASHVCLWI